MNKIVKNIIRHKTTCIFVSPHLDDAVFSAGGLLAQLAGKVPVVVINVFTSAGDCRSSISAKAFIRQCQAVSPRKLFADRRDEDMKALADLGIVPVNLNLTDSMWRKHIQLSGLRAWAGRLMPELVALYPTYRLHVSSGRVHDKDGWIVKMIQREIIRHLPKNGKYMVFSPLGIGRHVDHLLVREACRGFAPKVVYWGDFPYLLKSEPDRIFIRENRIKSTGILPDGISRFNLASKYQTQFGSVIRHPETLELPEIYYVHDK